MSAFIRNDLNLRFMGFCGVDDSCTNPEILQMISLHYPWVEWGVLLRPDLEGQPRYPTRPWIEKLADVNKSTGGLMRLAGHPCGSRCQQVLDGDFSFVRELHALGFGRVQVNATVANNVVMDLSFGERYVRNILDCAAAVPEVGKGRLYTGCTNCTFSRLSRKPFVIFFFAYRMDYPVQL